MARTIQVLLYSLHFLSVYSQHYKGHTNQRFQDIQKISDLLDLSKLLQSAARLAYPVTSGINHAVGRFMGSNDYVPSSRYYPRNSYERYPAYAPGRRANINRNNLGHIRSDFHNLRRVKAQNANRRHQYKSPLYDYNYDYDYDYDYDYNAQYSEPYDSLEVGNEFFSHNAGIQPKPESPDVNEILKSNIYKNLPHSKTMPDATNINNPDLATRQVAKVDSNSAITAKEVPNQLNIPVLPNKGNQVANGREAISPESIRIQPNLPVTQNKITRGNAVSASNTAQPNIVYVVLNPGGVDSETNDTINLLKSQALKSNEVGAKNAPNKFYIVPSNPGSDTANVENPISVISTKTTPRTISV